MKKHNILGLIALLFIILTLLTNSVYLLFAGFVLLAYASVSDERQTSQKHENNSI